MCRDGRGLGSKLFYYYFISFAKKTNKQTNKQKERWQGHCNSCGQLQRARTLKKIKTRNIKKHSDTRKTTAPYNKLLDETRDEHYYILQGRSQDFSKGGSQTGTPSGDRRLYMVIPLLSLVYQRAQSYYCGMKAHIN